MSVCELPGALVIGGGPAGLRAAEVISLAGHPVTLIEACPWPGRKLLVAGRGGLNITHSEDLEIFLTRYSGGEELWPELLRCFGPDQIREWMVGLGIETYVGTTRRIFPEGDQAGRLLRAWLKRLEQQGVEVCTQHRFQGFESPTRSRFESPDGPLVLEAPVTVLALGGGSWPQTGSDGAWVGPLRMQGLEVTPLTSSNCGFELRWPREFLATSEGLPLKNIALRFREERVRGELLVTRYGLEGGTLYHLGRSLRGHLPGVVELDLKPEVTVARLLEKLESFRGKGSVLRRARIAWKLCKVGRALLSLELEPDQAQDPEALAAKVKSIPLRLERPRPLSEAISSAGGVTWSELNQNLMVRKRPGTFLAGEMIDWDAPTGGYLLTGCLATGTRAGEGAVRWLSRDR